MQPDHLLLFSMVMVSLQERRTRGGSFYFVRQINIWWVHWCLPIDDPCWATSCACPPLWPSQPSELTAQVGTLVLLPGVVETLGLMNGARVSNVMDGFCSQAGDLWNCMKLVEEKSIFNMGTKTWIPCRNTMCRQMSLILNVQCATTLIERTDLPLHRRAFWTSWCGLYYVYDDKT